MSLGDLPASDLARIDSVCLQYESDLRGGESPSIDDLVRQHGGEHAEALREELEAIREEVQAAKDRVGATTPGFHSGPFPGESSLNEKIALPVAGDRIGPYTVGEEIGRGGMGVVYKAVDPRLDRVVAIKMLAVEASKRQALADRFQREAKAVATLSHPNIVELFDIGVFRGLPYAVMEYLDGDLLDQRFERGPMDPAEVRRVGAQIADALATAHAGGVIHRDLKPHNIMLVRRTGGGAQQQSSNSGEGGDPSSNESTVVKLFDFGLSRVPRSEHDDSDQTAEGVVLGTPGYMAPEQARGESVSPAADLFSLGCVLHEAFYGERAFGGDTSAARFRATIQETPQADPIRRRSDVALADLIANCLEKLAGDRPKSASAVATRLRSSTGTARLSRPVPEGTSIARRSWLAVTGGGVIGAVVGGMLAARDSRLGDIRSLAVLTLEDAGEPAGGSADIGAGSAKPIGDRDLSRGEKLSALLAHELSRITTLTVPQYRPIRAVTSEQFRRIGGQLGVDALLTGTVKAVDQEGSPLLVVQMQLISTATGTPLWNKRLETSWGNDFLQQSKLAMEIASAIDQQLTTTADEVSPPDVKSFQCFVDAKTRSDPESVAGLVRALKCFEDAHQGDQRYAAPLAGIALTSISLAAQSPADKSIELTMRARDAVEDALRLDPTSVDARLAGAMLDWQTTNRYGQAQRTLRELSMVAPNHWQVHHQYGLLQLAIGDFSNAAKSLRTASQLNPWSVLVKVDRARGMWFSGNTERAIREATRIRDTYDRHPLARGLLVDMYEHGQRFDDAIAQHDRFEIDADYASQDYWQERQSHLGALPYGPYGETMNRAILQTRLPAGIDQVGLAEIADSWPPMLPLLLASHPSFQSARLLDTAIDILPEEMS